MIEPLESRQSGVFLRRVYITNIGVLPDPLAPDGSIWPLNTNLKEREV